MKLLNADFVLDEESEAIVAFLEAKWEPISLLPSLVDSIRGAALHAARGWVERYDVSALAHALQSQRKLLLVGIGAPKDAEHYDAYLHFLDRVQSLDDTLYQAGLNLDAPWDYERRIKRLAWALTETFGGLPAMKPIGYDLVSSDAVDDLCEAYEPGADRDLFQGSKVEGVLSGTFPMRVALPYVKVEDRQGREPWMTLIGAIYAHFLGLQKYRNMWDLTSALTKAMPYDVPAVQFSIPRTTRNPFIRALQTWVGAPPSEDAYRGALRHRTARVLSAEEGKAYLKAEPALMAAQAEDIRRRHDSIGCRWPNNKDQYIAQLKAELDQAIPSN